MEPTGVDAGAIHGKLFWDPEISNISQECPIGSKIDGNEFSNTFLLRTQLRQIK